MKAVGSIILIVVIAAALYLMLAGRQTKESMRALGATGDNLLEGVDAMAFDQAQAQRDLETARLFVEQPQRIGNGSAELTDIGKRAAGWAEGAPTGSAELSFAAALRRAIGELREYDRTGDGSRLSRARTAIEEAGSALSGGAPVGQMQGVRDRLGNLEQGQREKIQDAEDALDY